MARRRVLYISNSHPDLYIGGAEVYSYELYKAMRESGEFEPILLARTIASGHGFRKGTPFHAVNDDPNQLLWFQGEYDHLFMSSPQKEQYTVHFNHFLTAYRPDVVHIQHTIGLGIDLIRQIGNSLPGTPIVYTLHEFMPICHAKGLMARTDGGELCRTASPARCHECFPDILPQRFFLRESFVKCHFRRVDLFLAPSRFLLERFVSWGIPRNKIQFQEYGRILQLPEGDNNGPSVMNIGYFGQLRPHKGVLVLLRAMKLLLDSGDCSAHLFLNGANLKTESSEFQQEVSALLEACARNITFLGEYETSEIPRRMREVAWVVVPSIWWENSPLVIQEAFMHRRPVICSDIGGMAEKVTDGVNGLHFRVGDAADLATTLRRATNSPDEWKRLRAGIQPVDSMEEAVAAHCFVYRSLLEES